MMLLNKWSLSYWEDNCFSFSLKFALAQFKFIPAEFKYGRDGNGLKINFCTPRKDCCGWACFTYPIPGVIPSTWLWNWCQGEYDVGNTRVAHAPRCWSWISWPTSSSCINRRGTKITSRYASRAQHLIPFQNSQGIITDMVVSSRGRLLGREPSLTTPFHKYSDFDRFFYGLRAELTLSRQPQYIKDASHWDMPKNCALVMWNLEDLCDINFNVPLQPSSYRQT